MKASENSLVQGLRFVHVKQMTLKFVGQKSTNIYKHVRSGEPVVKHWLDFTTSVRWLEAKRFTSFKSSFFQEVLFTPSSRPTGAPVPEANYQAKKSIKMHQKHEQF